MVGCLVEYQERFGTDAIRPHGFGRLFGLHELLEGFHVGHFYDQPYTVGVRGISESWPVIPMDPKNSCRLGE